MFVVIQSCYCGLRPVMLMPNRTFKCSYAKLTQNGTGLPQEKFQTGKASNPGLCDFVLPCFVVCDGPLHTAGIKWKTTGGFLSLPFIISCD